MKAQAEHPTERALAVAGLPDRIDDWRVLSVGAGDAGRDYLTGIGADEFVALTTPSEDAGPGMSGFDLVICSSDLTTDLHPLALYAWLRRAVKPEGLLIAGSAVLTDSTLSQYARFVPPRTGVSKAGWIPGRLALRWMIEVSGFEVVAWLDEGESTTGSEYAYLQARADDRPAALDLDRQPLGS